MAQRIIDISVGISPDMSVYPGDPRPSVENVFSIDADGFAVSKIGLGTHTGTHIDAPSHIIKGGASIDMLPLEHFYGRTIVLDLSSMCGNISGDDLESHFKRFAIHEKSEAVILLLKTTSHPESICYRKEPSNVYFDETAGKWFLSSGFKTVGIDMFSIDSGHDSNIKLPNHKLLLNNGICIIENLDLTEIKEGIYDLICFPLKLIGCDASPARAILIETQVE